MIARTRNDCILMNILKGTPGYKYKSIYIHSQWFLKMNGATFICVEILGKHFGPGQCWSCLWCASLSVPSGMAIRPDFWSCGPLLRPLYCCDKKLCSDGVGRSGLKGFHQLLSQLRIMHFNSKIIRIFLKINFYLRLRCNQCKTYCRKYPWFDSLRFL